MGFDQICANVGWTTENSRLARAYFDEKEKGGGGVLRKDSSCLISNYLTTKKYRTMFVFTLEITGKIGAATFDHEKETVMKYQSREDAREALRRKFDALYEAQKSKSITKGSLTWEGEDRFVAVIDKRGYKATEVYSIEEEA